MLEEKPGQPNTVSSTGFGQFVGQPEFVDQPEWVSLRGNFSPDPAESHCNPSEAT